MDKTALAELDEILKGAGVKPRLLAETKDSVVDAFNRYRLRARRLTEARRKIEAELRNETP